jgi:uncharacterized membrane protein YphA (DoxX/SURF4 family)
MFLAAVLVTAALAALLLLSGVGKLRRDPGQMQTLERVRFPADKVWLLAVAEIAGAVGLVVGLFWWPIGVAAAIGVIAYFVGAVASHLRVRDRSIQPPAVLLLVGVSALVLRLVTL